VPCSREDAIWFGFAAEFILISSDSQKPESVRGKKMKKNPVKLLIFQTPKNASNKQMVQTLTDQMMEEIRGIEKPKKKEKKKD
jgi:hypothetical protein